MRIAALPLMFVAACAAQSPPTAAVPDQGEPTVTDAAPLSGCDASKAQFAVNRTASDRLAAEARGAAGAATVRQLVPGQMVTQEFRGDRLNLELAVDGKVSKVRCG